MVTSKTKSWFQLPRSPLNWPHIHQMPKEWFFKLIKIPPWGPVLQRKKGTPTSRIPFRLLPRVFRNTAGHPVLCPCVRSQQPAPTAQHHRWPHFLTTALLLLGVQPPWPGMGDIGEPAARPIPALAKESKTEVWPMASTANPSQRTIWKFTKAVRCSWQNKPETFHENRRFAFYVWIWFVSEFGSLRAVYTRTTCMRRINHKMFRCWQGQIDFCLHPCTPSNGLILCFSASFFVRIQNLVGHNNCCCHQRSMLLGQLQESHGFLWLPRFCRTPEKATAFGLLTIDWDIQGCSCLY